MDIMSQIASTCHPFEGSVGNLPGTAQIKRPPSDHQATKLTVSLKDLKMFSSPWDLVRPRFWYPMPSLEQSMMDLELMHDRMRRSQFPFRDEMLAAPSTIDDDDDFFRDLPVIACERLPATQHNTSTGNDGANADGSHDRAFSSYSFSNSSVVDDKGRRVVSTRRRYEDSTGRLKAVHERQIEGKKLRTVWSKQSKEDAGMHVSECSSGSPDEFEQLWQSTPFGEAQKKTITSAPERGELKEGVQMAIEKPQLQEAEEVMDFVDVKQKSDETKP